LKLETGYNNVCKVVAKVFHESDSSDSTDDSENDDSEPDEV